MLAAVLKIACNELTNHMLMHMIREFLARDFSYAFCALDILMDTASSCGVTEPASRGGVAEPASGNGVAEPASGNGVAEPASGHGVAEPASGDEHRESHKETIGKP